MSDKIFELERISSGDELTTRRANGEQNADYPDAYAYGYGYETQTEGFHLRSLYRAIRKHIWMVILIPIAVTSFVAIEVSRPKPTYESSAIVELKKDAWVMVKTRDSVIEEEADTALSSPTIKTNTLMLKSRPLLQEVVLKLQLERESRFFDITKKRRSFTEAVKSLFSSPDANGESHVADIGLPGTSDARVPGDGAAALVASSEQESAISEERQALLSRYVKVLQDNLYVEPIKDTRALRISFTHTNPILAAAIANGIAEGFIERSFQNRTAKFNSATAWLERTTSDLKTKVRESERALADYSRDHGIYAPDAKDTLITTKLTRLHGEVLRAETERMLKESLYEEVKAGRIAQLPEAFADSTIASLQTQLGQLAVQQAQLALSYGPKNPQVIEINQKMATIQAQVNTGRSALEEKLKAEFGRAVRDEQTLKTALAQAKADAVQQNQDAVQFDLLKQDADTARALYTQFLQKTNQANIQVAEQPSNVRLIEPADVPSFAHVPNRLLYIVFGLLASLTASVGLAFLVERLNKKINTIEDVNRYVQLPAIGVIPELKGHLSPQLASSNGSTSDGSSNESTSKERRLAFRPIVAIDDRSMASEAYRTISTSVLLASSEDPPKTILITSGLPSEGKTTTAINTAISLAQIGPSVLIIDCDLRNPTSHKVFGIANNRGLSTYLESDVELDDLICELKIPNVSLLPAGPSPRNPAKLIISPKMKSMLKTLGQRYDHILIDSPPLIGVNDAIILSTLVDGVIVVVHGKKSTRELARRTRYELSNFGAKIFGVVLNGIDITDYQYYYPYYKPADSTIEKM